MSQTVQLETAARGSGKAVRFSTATERKKGPGWGETGYVDVAASRTTQLPRPGPAKAARALGGKKLTALGEARSAEERF